ETKVMNDHPRRGCKDKESSEIAACLQSGPDLKETTHDLPSESRHSLSPILLQPALENPANLVAEMLPEQTSRLFPMAPEVVATRASGVLFQTRQSPPVTHCQH